MHHGLPLDLYQPNFGRGEYLAFLGRICPEKRADRAIEIARQVGLPLKIAAKVDRADYDYYRRKIKPLIEGSDVEFVGEINGAAKNEFLGKARALLFPIDWPEPFGLVMIEAMACGLPVVAWPCGSVPEVIEDGVSGFIVDSVDAAVRAVETIDSVSRETCRATFETRFSARRMAEDYVRLYEKIMACGRIDETRVMGDLRASLRNRQAHDANNDLPNSSRNLTTLRSRRPRGQRHHSRLVEGDSSNLVVLRSASR